MSVLVIEHSDSCSPAMVGQWLGDAGLELHRVRGHRGEPVPQDLSDHRALLVMGGPMNAYDDEQHPWLPATRSLLREAVDSGMATLGICLGHQLLAVACGGEVTTLTTGKQLGPYPITRTAVGRRDPLLAELPEDSVAVHWNGDIVATPPHEAVVLATTAAGVQALRIGDRAWGVQFHPEVLTAEVRAWAERDVAEGKLAGEEARRVLAGVDAAAPRLVATFEPLVRRFAALVS